MLERLQKIINEFSGRDDIVITPKTKISNKEYNFSSFALIQLICAVEDEFDIEIPNAQIKKLKTVKDIISLIEAETK